MKAFLFWLIHMTWGLPTFIFGVIQAFFMLITGNRPYVYGYCIAFETKRGPISWFIKKLAGESWGGSSMGPFIIVCKLAFKQKTRTMQHEHGHALQALRWGVLDLFVIGIPSFLRYWYREIIWRKARKATQTLPSERTDKQNKAIKKWQNMLGYDDIWFEGQATRLGTEFIEARNANG